MEQRDVHYKQRKAIATEESSATQEPVAWMHPSGGVLQHLTTGLERNAYTIPLYTHPQPKREWVGLTNEEIIDVNMSTVTKLIDEPIVCDTDSNIVQFGKAIEAKLKEKNT